MKIAWIGPKPNHRIFQHKLLHEELKKLGDTVLIDKVEKDTDWIVCTSVSRARDADEFKFEHNKPMFTWVMDICDDMRKMPYLMDYIIHIRQCDNVASICEAMQWDTINLTGQLNVDVLYPCVDDETIKRVPTQYRKNQILYIGSLQSHKEPEELLYAWMCLEPPRPKLVFLFQDGNFSPQLIRECKRIAPYHGHISFHKGLSDWKKFELIKQSKLLVMPSSYGGFNLPPIEALMCGTPVLVSDDHNYITFRDTCFRYKTHDIEDMSKKMGIAYNNYSRVKDKRTIRWLDQFTIKNCAKRLHDYLEMSLKK